MKKEIAIISEIIFRLQFRTKRKPEESTTENLHTTASSTSHLLFPEAESVEPHQLDKAPSTMAPSSKFAVRTPALDLSASAQDGNQKRII